ncbi:MAG: D-tyrosyl-tRNA(Tyr) deacylase [Candidatus Eremiobacteraeota bacterium]|nr:D-tyrosyl-tRNA(Tyr) deacylase [Candidatus Eremiobacteraeota bacterium]MBV8262391.1 D-tyrosyl-tRNA(Tyr) deacylase [Candidatus Eremiobacteraeota bacterium]MBV8339858.1 D-tyrosyl-tRNA(Tyr) deacylase [Candidatus Eremiobacteraeota bacterium]
MRAVVQRVSSASVEVDGKVCGAIDRGFLALVGVARDDAEADAQAIASKIAGLRVFNDKAGAMNLAPKEVGGAVLAVSQFTLYGDARKGRRPSFIDAAEGKAAKVLFERVVELIRREGLVVETGIFGADMHVSLVNEGPVTILIDSRKTF